MDGSLDEAKRQEPSPVAADESRKVRLSVVIDGRLDAARARQVATLTDRLGLAGVWLRHPWWPLSGTPVSENVTPPARPGRARVRRAGSAGTGCGTPAPLTRARRTTRGPTPSRRRPDPGLPGWRRACGSPSPGSPPAITRWQGLIGRRPGLTVTQLALPAREGAAQAAAVFVRCTPGRDLAGEVSAAAAAAGGRPVLAEVTVSVGRTAAEARARADADELFTLAGHPAQQGLFGTLGGVPGHRGAARARPGATELVCYLPLASDLPDVLAQLRSIAIGAGVLRPGQPPSAAPPPPPAGAAAGSRPDRPWSNVQNNAAWCRTHKARPAHTLT